MSSHFRRVSRLFENLFIVVAFSLTFGSMLTAQFWLGEQVVFPVHDTQTFYFVPLSAAFIFIFTGILTPLITDKILLLFASPPDTIKFPHLSEGNVIVTSAPSLMVLVFAWLFLAFSRLNEFILTIITFCFALICFGMVEFQSGNRALRILASWVGCNIVTLAGTAVAVASMTEANEFHNEIFGIAFSLSSSTLSGVLPLWFPSLMLLVSVTWGQLCRSVFKM